jgi:DNA polymerase/3'-5' exonuclease PolX
MTTPMTDHRTKIIAELDILRKISVSEPAGTFKSRAYAAAIKAIQAWSPVYSAADVPPPVKGDGVGKEIRIKIQKIIEAGQLDIPAATRERAVALEVFQGIYGVGPKKAEDLIAAGYRTIAELRAATAANPKLFNKNQHVGLRYYEDINERIPRSEMDQHVDLLMRAKPVDLEGCVVGSYRRGKADSGDIDMLIRTTHRDVDASASLRAYVDSLKKSGYIREVLAQGDHKCLAVAALPGGKHRRLDLLVTPPAEFPFAIFYFTGSDTFNVAVRSHALDQGYTLNEHALTTVKSGLTLGGVHTERDIFRALKIEWREPNERTGPEAVTKMG